MKIAFLLNSVSRNAGGLFDICRRLGQTLAERDEVQVLGVRDEFTAVDLAEWAPLKPVVFRPALPGSFGVAKGYAEELQRLDPTLVHVHALWIYPSLAGYRWHRRTKRPLIYTAHGMLDPWAVRNSGWKKQLVRTLWEDAAHRSANCFHVNSEAEYQTVREYGLTNPICVIPNGMDIPKAESLKTETLNGATGESDIDGAPRGSGERAGGERIKLDQRVGSDQKEEVGSKTLLYLGRLHPKKNLGAMLEAWAITNNKQPITNNRWRLVIAGWDQAGYEADLKALASDLGLLTSVSFVGPKFGEDKAEAYRNADAFILPSLSEGLPMVVLEAWAYGKPVLMTPECNLPEGFAAGAALEIGTTPETIAAGLRQLMEMSESEREAMGAKGRALVETNFSWPRIGEQMRSVYEWVLGGGTPPECVRLV